MFDSDSDDQNHELDVGIINSQTLLIACFKSPPRKSVVVKNLTESSHAPCPLGEKHSEAQHHELEIDILYATNV